MAGNLLAKNKPQTGSMMSARFGQSGAHQECFLCSQAMAADFPEPDSPDVGAHACVIPVACMAGCSGAGHCCPPLG